MRPEVGLYSRPRNVVGDEARGSSESQRHPGTLLPWRPPGGVPRWTHPSRRTSAAAQGRASDPRDNVHPDAVGDGRHVVESGRNGGRPRRQRDNGCQGKGRCADDDGRRNSIWHCRWPLIGMVRGGTCNGSTGRWAGSHPHHVAPTSAMAVPMWCDSRSRHRGWHSLSFFLFQWMRNGGVQADLM